MRVKHRYLLFQASEPMEDLELVIQESILENFGQIGLGRVVFSVRYYSQETKLGIIKCLHQSMRLVWGAIFLLKQRITVLHCSGTIKKTILKAIEHDKREISINSFI